jgi:Pyruvate/2-oxoacid:ferredoxin oxidoreductase delta subunit
MSAIEIIRSRLAEAGFPPASGPKESKPPQVAFVDVNACVGCGLCLPQCPTQCIETLSADRFPDRDAPPVQVRYQDCVGCIVCLEVCTHLAGAGAIRSYDTNLAEQALSCEIGEGPDPTGSPPEAWEDIWAEDGAFHHMGETSQIEGRLSPEDRASISAERQNPA